ncbi:channel protein TolC [Pseudomonas sp. WN033]|nr:channel protein TolC [Pseudomonas sp. WN033]
MRTITTWQYLIMPLALSVSLAAQGQSLPQAIQTALDTHPQIRATANSRLAANEDLKGARAGYLPTIDLSAGYGREGTDSPATRAGGDHWKRLTRGEGQVRLGQMLFDGFATPNDVRRNEATVNSRAYRVLSTAEQIALATVEAYHEVLMRREMVRLAEDNLSSHQRVHDQIRLRSERGVGRNADFDQAEARLALARNNLVTEQANLIDAEAVYYSVVSQLPGDLSLPGPIAHHLPGSLESALANITNNPLIKVAEADHQAAQKQYEGAKAPFYPRFDLELSRNVDNNLDGSPGHYNEWQAMLRMRYNLYSGGRDQARMHSSAHQMNEALEIRNNAYRQLTEELRLAWNAMDSASQQVPIAQQYVDYSVRVREAYRQQFNIGERTLLDLLDSENELFTAQRRLTETRFVEYFSQYRLLAVTGDLLRSQSIVAPAEAMALSEVHSTLLPTGQ